MNTVYDIDSVRVYGEIAGPGQILLLTLGIEGTDEQKSFVLNSWGAEAIMSSLASAGVQVKTDEQPQEQAESVADDGVIEAQFKT